jgi:alkylhydroperoxidase family enzyme
VAGRALGITREMVDAIPNADASSLFTEQERAAIALALELTARAELSNETFARAARHFSERQLVELVVNVGVANLNNRVTDAFWADIEESE